MPNKISKISALDFIDEISIVTNNTYLFFSKKDKVYEKMIIKSKELHKNKSKAKIVSEQELGQYIFFTELLHNSELSELYNYTKNKIRQHRGG